jgi:hypothetical protein
MLISEGVAVLVDVAQLPTEQPRRFSRSIFTPTTLCLQLAPSSLKRIVDDEKEQHPFELWAELEAIAAAIGPRYGPMILFAAVGRPRPERGGSVWQRAHRIEESPRLRLRAAAPPSRSRRRRGTPRPSGSQTLQP